MKFIDLHCDTLMWTYIDRREDMCRMPYMLDVERMKAAGQLAQVFAIFLPPPGEEARFNRESIDDDDYIESCMKAFHATLERCGEAIAFAGSAADLAANGAAGKVSAILSFEDGRAVQGSMEKLAEFHRQGIRLITLTWNHANCFGAPNSPDPKAMALGLTDFGKEAIPYMNELGIIVDVSHLSDGGFYDVAARAKKPFIASHSNCRALSPHPRNLSDEMLRILADQGGVSGLNFCPAFLHQDTSRQDSTLAAICAHIHHMIDVAGVDAVALGSDFDGIEGQLEIASPGDMEKIFQQLDRDGLSTGEIEKIAYGNALRVLGDTL